MRNDQQFDQYLICFLLAILGVVTALIQYDFSFFSTHSSFLEVGGKKVASLRSQGNAVRRRPAALPVWKDVPDSVDLSGRDQIFTGPHSEADIQFENGDFIRVAENSLLTVEAQESSTELNIDRGTFSTRLATDQSKIKVNIGGVHTEISGTSGSEIKIHAKPEGGADISVVKGSVKARIGDQLTTVGENQILKTDSTGSVTELKTVKIQLLEPAENTRVYFLASRLSEIDFRWHTSETTDQFRILIARDSDFTDLISSVLTKDSEWNFSPTIEGAYHWRIEQVNAEGTGLETSQERTFTAIEDKAVVLINPLPGDDLVKGDETGDTLHFSFEEVRDVEKYLFEVSTEPGFTQPLVHLEVSDSPVQINYPLPGSYFWRMRILSSDRPLSPMSETRSFKVLEALPSSTPIPPQGPKPPPPSLKQQKEFKFKIEIDDESSHQDSSLWDWLIPKVHAGELRRKAVLSWPQTEGATGYIFELAQDKDFKALVKSGETPKAQYTWRDVIPGKYFLRVAIIDQNGQRSDFSESVIATFEYSTPILISPSLQGQIKLKETEQETSFKWDPLPKINHYQVEISKDPSFNQVETRQDTVEPETHVSLLDGVYHWRVQGRDSTGMHTPWSEPWSFEVSREKSQALNEKISEEETQDLKEKSNSIFLGYCPGSRSYSYTGSRYSQQTVGHVLNSYCVGGEFRVSDSLWIEPTYRSSSLKLFGTNATSAPASQPELTFQQQHLSILAIFLLGDSSQGRARSFAARLGYLSKTILNFGQVDGANLNLAAANSQLMNLGLEYNLLTNPHFGFRFFADYRYPLAVSGGTSTNALDYSLGTQVRYLQPNWYLGVGLLFEKSQYHLVEGTLNTESISSDQEHVLQVLSGWRF